MGARLEDWPNWPAAMRRDASLAYTGVSEAQLRQWERSGKVRFQPRGPNGSMLALRRDLDAALHELFNAGSDEDLSFG